MKTLFIARHAEAKSNYDDFERELSSKGLQQAFLVGKQIADYFLQPKEIWTSAANRTLRTAEIIAEQIGFSSTIMSEKELYNASVRVWLKIIQNLQSDVVLLVGHNPHISYLAELLTGKEIGSMQTSQVLVLQSENDWSNWGEKSAQLLHSFFGESENL
ncbi:MAG: histidine phosphatase family protein [Thermonemataceae bacterium]|nr:histidine phosphatase family protein [Thermonemataceae bacterium]